MSKLVARPVGAAFFLETTYVSKPVHGGDDATVVENTLNVPRIVLRISAKNAHPYSGMVGFVGGMNCLGHILITAADKANWTIICSVVTNRG
jgi:hypothetical protein